MHASVPLPPGTEEVAPPPSKVVLIYVPGLDSELVDRGMREEYLPNLRRLRVDGTQVTIGRASRSEFWSGRAEEFPLLPEVRDADAPTLLPDREPTRLPPKLPTFAVSEFPSFVDLLAQNNVDVIALGAPYPVVTTDLPHKRAIAAGMPSATFDGGGFLFVREIEGGATTKEVPGGRVIEMRPSTSSRDEATFSVDVLGPKLGVDGAALMARLEIRSSLDRMRAVVRSQDDASEIMAGRFSKPIRLRFQVSKDLVIYARTRVYLRPTGRERLEAYIEPLDFTPVLPPRWIRVSSPADYAAEVERAHGDLPGFNSPLPRAAMDLGLLDFRDGVAALDSNFAAARSTLGAVLADGGFRVLTAEFDLIEDAAWLATRGHEDEVVEFRGNRIAKPKFEAAAAGAIDKLLGEVLARVDKRDRKESISLILVTSGRNGKPGFASLSRLIYDIEPGRPVSDIVATACALVGVIEPPGIAGKSLPLGNAMEPLSESNFEKRPVREPESEAAGEEAQTSKK